MGPGNKVMDDAHAAALIERALEELAAQDALNTDAGDVVTLDQQSVGRLSRMDAMQAQAMAKAQTVRRSVRRQALIAARLRLENGEYGWCAICGDDIPDARLALDPAAATCVGCRG